MFVKDEGYLLNIDNFFPIEIREIGDLTIDSKNEKLSRLRNDLDKVKGDA